MSLRLAAFSNTLNLLSWRIDLMLAIRLDQFEALVLEQRLQEIPSQTPPSAEGSLQQQSRGEDK